MTFKCSNGGLQWLLPEVHKIWTMYYLIFMFWLITQSVTDWYVKWFGASQSPKQAGRNQKMADLQERQLENRGRKQVLGGAELLFEIHHFHCAKKTWTPMTRDHVIEVFMTRNKLLKNSVTGNVERDRHWLTLFFYQISSVSSQAIELECLYSQAWCMNLNFYSTELSSSLEATYCSQAWLCPQ